MGEIVYLGLYLHSDMAEGFIFKQTGATNPDYKTFLKKEIGNLGLPESIS